MTKSIFCLFFLAFGNLLSAQLRVEVTQKFNWPEVGKDIYSYEVYETKGTPSLNDDVLKGTGSADTEKILGLTGVSAAATLVKMEGTQPEGCSLYFIDIYNEAGVKVARGAWGTRECDSNSSSN